MCVLVNISVCVCFCHMFVSGAISRNFTKPRLSKYFCLSSLTCYLFPALLLPQLPSQFIFTLPLSFFLSLFAATFPLHPLCFFSFFLLLSFPLSVPLPQSPERVGTDSQPVRPPSSSSPLPPPLLLSPPFSSLTGSRRQPCFVLDV